MIENNKKGAVLAYNSSRNNTSSTARVLSPNLGYQELEDYSSTGRKRPWSQKKSNSVLVADSFSRISQKFPESGEYYLKKADRIYNCGTYLEFKRFEDGTLDLNQAYFCRQRLCPMCNWRRSLKIFSQVSKIMDCMNLENDYEYLFLTLTIRNVDAPELKQAVSELIRGSLKLIRRNKVRKSILGTFRALEVTYNEKAETYHPHLHMVLVVNKSYLKKGYITQKEWSNLWADCMDLDYTPIVHIQTIKGNKKAAVAEVAKYATKEEDLFTMDENKEKTAMDEVIYTLDDALKGRRLISFSGVFKDYQQKLKLEDVEDSDLLHIDEDKIRKDMKYVIETYNWRCGTYLTKKIDSDIA